MRKEILSYIHTDPELKTFIRAQPFWYRKLSRDPSQLSNFILSSKEFHKKTIPQRVEQFSQQLHMASMMINMFQVMREND